MRNIIVYFYEHNLFLNNSWRNWRTCLKDFDNCPLCDSGVSKSYYGCAFTIIDTTKFKSEKRNQMIKNVRKLVVFKKTALDKLKRRRDSKLDGDLTNAVIEVARGDTGKDPATGDDFEVLKRLTPAELKKLAPKQLKTKKELDLWMSPFDYRKILAPQKAESLARLVGMAQPVGGAADRDLEDNEDKADVSVEDDDLEKFL